MVAIGSGISAQMVGAQETTYGVAPTSFTHSYEFKSETFALKKTTVQGHGLHAGGLYDRAKRRILSTYDATGNLVMDLPCNGLGLLLQNMIGSYGQTAASPAQQGSTGAYTQVHNPGTMLGNSLSFQKGAPATDGTVQPFTYVGGKVTGWTIKCEVNQIAELDLTCDFRNELAGEGNGDPLNTVVPGLATPSYPVGMELFHFREATLYTGGIPTLSSGVTSLTDAVPAGQVKSTTIQGTNHYDTARYFLGNNGFKGEPIENNFRALSGTFDVEWQSDEAWYNAFAADTTTSLQLTFIGPVIGSTNAMLDVIVPNIKLDGSAPHIPGPAVVQQEVPFTALDDETTTPIQFTFVSTDTAI
jgi:hypothetical protein